MKIKNLFMAVIFLTAFSILPSCSNGVVIPQPVCDYGQAICQTLTYLCESNLHWNEDHNLADSLYKDLEQIDKRLKLYKKVIEKKK